MDSFTQQCEQGRAAATSKVEKSIAADLSEYFSFDDLALPDEEPTVEELINQTKDKLILMQKTSNLPEHILADITRALLALEKLRTIDGIRLFNSVTVKKLNTHIAEHKAELIRQKEKFAEELSRYQALCAMLDQTPEKFSYSHQASVALEREIEAMESRMIKQQEQQYISKCVDLVMADMGYDLIGSRKVKKRNGKQFCNELYTFDEGTAVNVTYSSDGQIAMELAGISREDRLPTEEETQVLTENMEAFCGEFAELESRLRAKGIILGNRIAMSPPSADYAAIINVNDYNITSHSQFSEISVAHRKKTKAVEKKLLRRDS